MRYAQIRPFDVANGVGVRTTIFVTGCTNHCPSCFNPSYQDFSFGEVWTEKETETVIGYLKKPVVAGLTLLGGEPMQNLELTKIVRKIRAAVDTNIWVYSGYTYEQILADPAKKALLDECDVLVDGLFVEALLDLKLKFRGSSNQRILDIKRSEEAGHPVEVELP
uniref:anaerobic ribonucleoside-triphosphate reductase activating protein n=1 Tax=Ndongobacter massiliensis TaxID=1871025 RepID=UPI000931189D|nr:anaerobic ribonucleoside-triphosphate reductase activating protein [Ndongobacter massiliensis]